LLLTIIACPSKQAANAPWRCGSDFKLTMTANECALLNAGLRFQPSASIMKIQVVGNCNHRKSAIGVVNFTRDSS